MTSQPTPPSSSHAPAFSAGQALFELWTGPFSGRDLAVVSFQGREGISKLFSFEVLVVVDAGTELLDAKLLMQPATLVIKNPGRHPRVVQGVVASVRPEGAVARGRRSYRVRVVPRLWLLKHRVTSRIFQDMTVPDIVSAVLRGAAVPCAWNTSYTHPMRGYCVQYQESDLAFIQRLLAEEGFFFWFDHPASTAPLDTAETVVIADSIQAYPAIAAGAEDKDAHPSPHLALREVTGMTESDDNVHRFELRHIVRPNRVLLRDYDFRRPLLDLRSEAELRAKEIAATASAVTAATALAGATASGERDLRIYRYRGDFDEPEVNPRRAQVELEQHRRAAATGRGASACRRLLPGSRFHLDAEGSPELAGEYVITHVEHEGHTPELTSHAHAGGDVPRSYHNRFTCVPTGVPFRPKRRKRELWQVMESATVVGPPGEDIYTDEHGRIKVQFHWDLEGKRNEHSSCWIRVVQPWAGASWGSQFIPRVGMEVMVTFLGGDQDCPVVSGCVYNTTHPTPFRLPVDRTRSGLRTNSSPGGAGFNELSFEDRAGAEQVFLHAQRDLDEVVGRDHTRAVTANEAINVGGNRVVTVTGALVEQIVASRTLSLAGSRTEAIGGSHQEQIRHDRFVSVNGNASDTVHGRYFVSVAQGHNLKVQGTFSTEVGTDAEPGGYDLITWGDYTVGTEKRATIRAEKGLVLLCGDSSIELGRDAITLRAPTIKLAATKLVSVSSKGPTLRLDEEAEIVAKTVKIYSSKASVELDEDAEIDGTTVKLNCKNPEPPIADDATAPPPTQHLSVRLTDAGFKPYANKDYVLRAAGNKYEGKTDGDGKVEVELPLEATVANITLWLDKRPVGPVKRYAVELREIPDPDTLAGAQMRLRNLGYYWGKETEEIDAATRQALEDFQGDHGIPITGELDEATKAKLSDTHGH